VRGTVYTIPPALANQAVKVRLYAEHFEVLDRQGRLAFSRRYVPDAEKGRLIIDPTHQATAQKRRPRGASRRLDQAFLKRFPSLTPFVSGLQLKMKSLTPIHIRALLRLADQYGQQTLLAAATKAQDARRFDSLAVQRILQRDCPAVADSPIAPLGGFGPVVVGEVEPASLDQFGHLDTQESKKDEDKECP